MDSATMTQLTIFSILMVYFWLMVIIAFVVVSVMRRRRLSQLELAFVHSNPPMPYIVYRSVSETQEISVATSTRSTAEMKQVVRHINPSEQVMLEIHPDSEQLNNPQPETNLHRLFAQIKEGISPTTPSDKKAVG